MENKRLRFVNLFVWGGAGLLLVGIVLGYLSLAPQLDALFHTSNVAQVATVVVTPTPEVIVPLLPFQEEAPSGEIVMPEVTPLPGMTSRPTPTSTPSVQPEAATPVATIVPEGFVPVRLFIPDIELEAPIVPIGLKSIEVGGVQQLIWNVPNRRAAGWHETSAKIGVPGNTVLNGHNTSNGEVFRYLYKLEVGATIMVEADNGATYTYTVTEKLILPEAGRPLEVRIQNAQYILPTADERLTLVTCHPYNSLANRLLIIAHPVALPAAPSALIKGD